MTFKLLNSLLIIGVLLLAGLFEGCVSRKREQSKAEHNNDWTHNAEAWADSVLRTLTLEERVGQLFMPASYASVDYFTIRRLMGYVADHSVGGVVFLQGDVASQKILSDSIQRLSSVPMFIAMDAEWGLGMRLKDAPVYPLNGKLGHNADDQLMYEYGYELARQAKTVGVNMILGPVLDVLDASERDAIGLRSFGSDPARVAQLGVAYAKGVEDGNVMSVGKHFPGHGAAQGDSHSLLPVVDHSLSCMDSVDLLPFREYAKAGLSAVMVGHIFAPAIDDVKRSAALSPVVTTDCLKHRIGFGGLVITDALNMKGAEGGERLGLKALLAGADLVLAPENTSVEIRTVIESVLSGETSEELISSKCRRVLLYKYRFIVSSSIYETVVSDSISGKSEETLRRSLESL